MPDPVDLRVAIGLPPEKAIEYFRAKGYAITWDWRDLWQEAQARAFTVAKVMRTDILEDIRGGLNEALTNGTTLRDFEKKLTPILQDKGWWGKTEHVNTLTGEVSTAQLGSPRRLKTIYQTNLQTAYMAGRYKQMMESVDSHPYWQYVSVLDGRTRPLHRAMNGRVFRYDDALWGTLFPPNGFNCRCRVRPLTAAQVEALGIKVDSSEGRLIDHEIPMRDGSTVTVKALRVQVNGQDKLFAPDAGWSYNPGAASGQAAMNTQVRQKLDRTTPAIAAAARSSLAMAKPEFIGQRPNLFKLPPVPVVEITGQEFGADLSKKQLALAADALLRASQKRPGFANLDTGWVLGVNKKGRDKMGDNADQSIAESQAVAALDDLVRYAVVAERHLDVAHQNEYIDAILRLYAPLDIGGKLHRVKLTVKDYKAGEKRLHALDAVEIENAPLGISPSSTSLNALQTGQPTTGRTITIADLLKNATMQDGKEFRR